MDKRIRRNELCIIGLPRCDFVFSSTRSCFIGYGFRESALEMNNVRHLLRQQGIEPIEAGGLLAPGQNAFCAKICSKIITAQFCVILLNNETRDGIEVPNANVNMEYGLMLGFNKYVIPFQRRDQALPFNVAGLDTVKYSSEDFEAQATKAIELAIETTTQDSVSPTAPDQVLDAFLLSREVLYVPLISEGDKNFFQLGQPLGFNLLMTFDGMQYFYFGNFTALRPEAVIWRVRTLERIVKARVDSLPVRAQLGIKIDAAALAVLQQFEEHLQIWVLVTSDDDKAAVDVALTASKPAWPVEVFSTSEMKRALQDIQ